MLADTVQCVPWCMLVPGDHQQSRLMKVSHRSTPARWPGWCIMCMLLALADASIHRWIQVVMIQRRKGVLSTSRAYSATLLIGNKQVATIRDMPWVIRVLSNSVPARAFRLAMI